MSVNIRYPNITGLSEREQLTQVKSFLHQLVDQLNYALPTVGSGEAQTVSVQGEEVSYYELRSLIIQELQEVEKLFDKLSQKMQSEYLKDEEVPHIVEEALSQAKASGEFDGPQGPAGPEGPQGPAGPQGIQGIQGPKGEDGTGVTILGSYDSADELAAAHPTGSAGDSYLVNGDLYVWSATANQWQNVGNIKGPKGDQGEKGDKGDKGDQGPQGNPGNNGADGDDGFSPIVAVSAIDGGHRVNITDKTSTKTFDVMDGVFYKSGLYFELEDGTIFY